MSDLHRERDPANYHYGVAVTPFSPARQQWDAPLGVWCERAHQWRMSCIITLMSSALILLLTVWLLTQPQTSVVALQMTKKGFVSNLGMLDVSYNIPLELKERFLQRYITALVSYTANVQKNKANDHYVNAFTSPEIAKALEKRHDLLSQTGALYQVKIGQISQISKDVFVVNWQRLVINPSSQSVMATLSYQGTFYLTRVIPQSEASLQENPLGFYVQRLTIKSLSASNERAAQVQQQGSHASE